MSIVGFAIAFPVSTRSPAEHILEELQYIWFLYSQHLYPCRVILAFISSRFYPQISILYFYPYFFIPLCLPFHFYPLVFILPRRSFPFYSYVFLDLFLSPDFSCKCNTYVPQSLVFLKKIYTFT